MTGPQAAAPPLAQRTASRQAALRQASLAALITLIVQYARGIGVNLYVTLPAGGTPERSKDQFFPSVPLATHAALGMLLVPAAIFVLVRAIIARYPTLIATSVTGLAAIVTAAVFGTSFIGNTTNANSMAMATAVALASYAVGLLAAPARRSRPS